VNFLTVDLSSFYLDFAKDVVYIQAEDSYELDRRPFACNDVHSCLLLEYIQHLSQNLNRMMIDNLDVLEGRRRICTVSGIAKL
jgi:isoleucyl-tRNA synthetase